MPQQSGARSSVLWGAAWERSLSVGPKIAAARTLGSVGAAGRRRAGTRGRPTDRAARGDARGRRPGPGAAALRLSLVLHARQLTGSLLRKKCDRAAPCAAGAALSPGPTGLDRQSGPFLGVPQRWRGVCAPGRGGQRLGCWGQRGVGGGHHAPRHALALTDRELTEQPPQPRCCCLGH